MPTLNHNNCFYLPARPAAPNLNNVPYNYLTRLSDILGQGNRADASYILDRLQHHTRGDVTVSHHEALEIQSFLKQIYLKLTAPDVTEEVKQHIIQGATYREAIQYCSKGYHIRLQEIIQGFHFPSDLRALIANYRHDLVDPICRQHRYSGGEVHSFNKCWEIARDEGYGVNPPNPEDRYGYLYNRQGFKDELRQTFDTKYSFFSIVVNAQNKIKDRLAHYGYTGLRDDDGNSYEIGECGRLYNFIRQFCPQLPEDSSFDIDDPDCIFIVDQDTYAIQDINWSRVSMHLVRAVKNLNYFHFNIAEQEIYDLLLNDEHELQGNDLLRVATLFRDVNEMLSFCENSDFFTPIQKLSISLTFDDNVFDNPILIRIVEGLESQQALEFLRNYEDQILRNVDLFTALLARVSEDDSAQYLDDFNFRQHITSIEKFEKIYSVLSREQQQRLIREFTGFRSFNELNKLFEIAAQEHYELLLQRIRAERIRAGIGIIPQDMPGMGGINNNNQAGHNLLILYKVVPNQFKIGFIQQIVANDFVRIARGSGLIADFIENTADEDKQQLLQHFPDLFEHVNSADNFVRLYQVLNAEQQTALLAQVNVKHLIRNLDDFVNIYQTLNEFEQEQYFDAQYIIENITSRQSYGAIMDILNDNHKLIVSLEVNPARFIANYEDIINLVKYSEPAQIKQVFEALDHDYLTGLLHRRYLYHGGTFEHLIKGYSLSDAEKQKFLVSLPVRILQNMVNSQHLLNRVFSVFDTQNASNNLNQCFENLGAEFIVANINSAMSQRESHKLIVNLKRANQLAFIRELVNKKKIDLLVQNNFRGLFQLHKAACELGLNNVSSAIVKNRYSNIYNLFCDLQDSKRGGHKITSSVLRDQVKVHKMKLITKGGAFAAFAVVTVPIAAGVAVAAVIFLSPGLGIAVLGASIISAGLLVRGCVARTTDYLRQRQKLIKLEGEALEKPVRVKTK